MSDKYVGASTDFLYYWDEIYGWIHVSEKTKLREAQERFSDSLRRKETQEAEMS